MRSRREIKWLCTLLALAIALASAASLRWAVGITIRGVRLTSPPPREVSLDLNAGSFAYEDDCLNLCGALGPWNTSVSRRHGDAVWLPTLEQSAWSRRLAVPLWLPLALFAVPASLLWWADVRLARRVRKGHCPTCGYDRRGLSGPCPECGRSATPKG